MKLHRLPLGRLGRFIACSFGAKSTVALKVALPVLISCSPDERSFLLSLEGSSSSIDERGSEVPAIVKGPTFFDLLHDARLAAHV